MIERFVRKLNDIAHGGSISQALSLTVRLRSSPLLLILLEHFQRVQDRCHTILPAKPLFQFRSICGRHGFRCSGDSRILLHGGRLRLGLLFQIALVLCQDGEDHLLQRRLIWNWNRHLRRLLAVDIVQDSADKKLRFAAALPVEQVDHRFMLWVTDVEANREFPGARPS